MEPIYFEITGGEVHDSKVACEVIKKVDKMETLVADKGYDSEAIREQVRFCEVVPVIPRRACSKKTNPEFDSYIYKLRHLIENLFAKLKHFR